MRPIRASEINTFEYCQRAWWYQKNGEKPINQAELAGGSALHERHGRAVMLMRTLRLLAYTLLTLALIMLAFQAVLRWL